MARLPSEQYVVQQIDGTVILFREHPEETILSFEPADKTSVSAALQHIRSSELDDQDKCFAYFWTGYFAAYAGHEGPGKDALVQAHDGQIIVRNDRGTEFTRFSPADANATAIAQKTIYDESKLSEEDKPTVHFWCGYFHAQQAQAE